MVSGEGVMYKSQRAVMLSFDVISEEKAKAQLMSAHTQQLTKTIRSFAKRLER